MRVCVPHVAALALLASIGGACSTTPTSERPPAYWNVARGHLRDPEGRAVILRGVNIANAHKRRPYLGFHGADDLRRVREAWGMNAIRLLVVWAAVEPERGQFDEAYLDEIAKRVEWAQAAGLLVVVDMHQDVYGEGFGGDGAPRWSCDESRYAAFKPPSEWYLGYLDPNVIACFDGLWKDEALQTEYAEAWRRVASRLARYEAFIGFDAVNEPHWGSTLIASFEEERLAPFYERLVPAVRSAKTHAIAFLEPSSSRNLGGETRLPRFSFRDVVYAPHSYDRDAEQGKGFDPAQRDKIIANVRALANEAKALDAALWIGEYGGVASKPGIAAYMDAQYDAVSAVGAGSTYWAYDRDDGYGLLAPEGSEKKELVDTLVRPFPERVAGDDVSWSYDESTRAFELRYAPRSEVAAPTVVSVPVRVYGAAYDVECGGCRYERGAGELRVTTPPSGGIAIVRVRP